MAFIPFFILSPNTLMSIAGYIHGPDKTVPTPAENWRDASVDVVIPALNEEQNIAPCLASIIRQTVRPKRIILIDDGRPGARAWTRKRSALPSRKASDPYPPEMPANAGIHLAVDFAASGR